MNEAMKDETLAKEFPLRLRARSGAAGVEAEVPWVSVGRQRVGRQEEGALARCICILPRPSQVEPR